jgi:hypothetical protein
MFKVNKPAKAKFRLGARVTSDWHTGCKFKVVKKEVGLYGEVLYDIESLPMGCELYRGVKEKDLNKA